MSAYSDLVLLDRPIVYWPLNDEGPTYADIGPSAITLQAVGTVSAHAYAGPLSGERGAGFGGSPEGSAPFSYAGYLVGNGDAPGFGAASVTDYAGHIASSSTPYVNLRGPLSIEGWLCPLSSAVHPLTFDTQAWLGWGDPDDDGTAAFGSGITAFVGHNVTGGYQGTYGYRSYQYNTWSDPHGTRTDNTYTTTDYRSQWVHVVQVVDKVGRTTIYINGVAQPLTGPEQWIFTFPPGNSLAVYPYQETAWFTLGNRNLAGTLWPVSGGVTPPPTGTLHQFRGGLAHVAMYNYALSACQVRSHYQTALGGGGCLGALSAPLLLSSAGSGGPVTGVQMTYALISATGGSTAAAPVATLLSSAGIPQVTLDLADEVLPATATSIIFYERESTASIASPVWGPWYDAFGEHIFSGDGGLPWTIGVGGPAGTSLTTAPPTVDQSCWTCLLTDPRSAIITALSDAGTTPHYRDMLVTYTFVDAAGHESAAHGIALVSAGTSGLLHFTTTTWQTREANNASGGYTPGIPIGATSVRWYVNPPISPDSSPFGWTGWRLAGQQTIVGGAVAPFVLTVAAASTAPAAIPLAIDGTCVVGTAGCTATPLPDPPDAPVLTADTPSESPTTTQLISAITARLIYLDGYGGYSLAGPSATLTPSGGAGRITVTAGGSGHIPWGVRRILLYCDSIQTVTPGGTVIANEINATPYYPITVSVPGEMPLIELWAHDATRFGTAGVLNDGQTLPALNTSSLPRPSNSTIPDPGPIPVGASIGGLSSLWYLYGVRYLKASLHLVYESPTGPPYGPSGHGNVTQLGPSTIVTSGTLTDTVSIPAMSGHPTAATNLWVWVLHYNDGTNLSGFYGFHVPITGGATAAFTFTTNDVNAQGLFDDLRYPIYYDEAVVNPTCPPLTPKSYNDLVLCDGPEVYWPLDGAGSTPYVDLGPSHNDVIEKTYSSASSTPPLISQGTGPIAGQGSVGFNGTTWLENGALAGVFYDVDTTGVYQTVGGNNVFTSLTFECWFRVPDPAASGNPTTFDVFIELFENSFTNSALELYLICGGGYVPPYAYGQAEIYFDNAFSFTGVRIGPVPDAYQVPVPSLFDTWHHLVVTYDWSASCHYVGPFPEVPPYETPGGYATGTTYYLDGIVLHTNNNNRNNYAGGWPGDAFNDWWSRADVVRLGANYGDGYGYPDPPYHPKVLRTGCSLAGVALYNYALSACQVLAHYQKATTGSYTPCSPCCMSAAQAAMLRRLFRQIQIPW